jgi:hypothetical protein
MYGLSAWQVQCSCIKFLHGMLCRVFPGRCWEQQLQRLPAGKVSDGKEHHGLFGVWGM